MKHHQRLAREGRACPRTASSNFFLRTVFGVACWGVVLPLVLAGCPAQMADVKRMGRTFDEKISDLNEREEVLEQKIQEAARRIEQQSQHAEQTVREARARLRHDIEQLREDEIPKLHGRLAENTNDVQQLRRDMDNLVASLNRKLDAKVNTLNTQHTKERARLDGLEKHQHDQFANIETEQGRLSSRLSEVHRAWAARSMKKFQTSMNGKRSWSRKFKKPHVVLSNNHSTPSRRFAKRGPD